MNYLLQVDGRGKNKKLLEGESMAMLKGWALMNTTGKSKCYIADNEKKVVMIVTGVPGSFPEINDKPEEMYIEGFEEEVKQ